MFLRRLLLVIFVVSFCITGNLFAHAHAHIGVNQDQQDGTADDGKLWMFGMPPAAQPENYWPNWPVWGDGDNPYDMVAEPFKLIYQDSGLLAGSYVCEYMECFHSAHPPHGNWQLGGTDEGTEPGWNIGIERVGMSTGLSMLDESNFFTPVLTADEQQYFFPKLWMNDKYNENGELGAWGIHYHLLFSVDGSVPVGQEFSAVLKVVDSGTTGYTDSEAHTFRFVTVPEPASMLMLSVGSVMFFRKRNH